QKTIQNKSRFSVPPPAGHSPSTAATHFLTRQAFKGFVLGEGGVLAGPGAAFLSFPRQASVGGK
ncbi:unnamed protein product, partial [Staurois parvus]